MDTRSNLRTLPARLAAGAAPLYKEVEREILQCLAAGEWKPGDRLPSETELAQRLGVAVFTLRAGIQKLVESGILLRRQGKGTFVGLHSARPLRNQFLRIYQNDGAQARWMRVLLSFEKTRADDAVAQTLGLGEKASDRAIYHIVCSLKYENRPIAILDIQLAARLFRGLSREMFQESQENFYAIYQEKGGANVIRIEERVRAALAGRRAAKLLQIKAKDPVLLVDRRAYTYHDVPVEVRRYTVESSSHHYFAPPHV